MFYKALMFVSSIFTTSNTVVVPKNQAIDAKKTIYDFKMKTLDGKEVSLAMFKGKKLLIVNTASECGYTPQYAELQKLHDKLGSKVTILGFPANNFGGQEPGSNAEIATFCQKNYGVTFQMFEKISVAGADMHPLYKFLSSKSENGTINAAPTWNFCKYLINEDGFVVGFFKSNVSPMSLDIVSLL